MKKLNKAQKQAVEYVDGPLLIVAGAGTGKTTVITEKIKYLIESGAAKPENILALTFTDKAAGEMQERVDGLLDTGYADLQISTFHTFCQRILERYGMDIGIPTTFKLVTDTDAWLMMKEKIYEFELDYYRPLGNPAKHIHNFLKHFSKCKDELITPEQYLEYAENAKLDKDAVQAGEKDRLTEVAHAYHKYNQLLLDNESLDFGDLIFYTHKLLQERPQILAAIQQRYTHILVDEFQDVNYAQYELVKLLTPGKGQLTVVGDDDQSIYAFRGASVSNILRFKEDFKKTQEVVLTENYRSGQEILDIAYKSIRHNDPDRLEVKLKIDKSLTSKVQGLRSGVEHMHMATLDDEVAATVEKIIELKKNDDVSWDDIAILVRANNHAEPFLNALEKARIPYEFLSSRGLYRQPVVLDCFHFFKLIEDVHQTLSVYRLLRIPFFEFSENDLQKFTYSTKKKSISYYEALKRAKEFRLSPEGVAVCEKLISLIHSGIKKARYEKPTAVLYGFLEESGYLAHLTDEEERGNGLAIQQIHHLKQFMDGVRDYETVVTGANVQRFVAHMDQVFASGDEGSLEQVSETPESVNIMTIHGSKGLEFDYVFVVNMVEDRFPTRRRSEVIVLPDSLVKEQVSEGDYHIQEERRLFYVAMTRARKHLYLTSADNYGGVRKKKLSRFLAELEESLPLSGGVGGGRAESAKDGFAKRPSLATSNRGEELSSTQVSYQLPKAFSFSQIRAFQTCKYQYKLAHVLKIPLKGSPYFSFGTTMHSALQKFYERVQEMNSATQGSLFGSFEPKEKKDGVQVPTKEELFEIYEKAWIGDWYKSKNQREKYYKKGKDILNEFYTSHKDAWVVPISLEGWFKVRLGKYLVHGRIDRIDQMGESIEIIDYKTGQSKEKLTGSDKDQLIMYQIAAQMLPEYHHFGVVGQLTFYYLNDGMKTSFVATEKDIEKLEGKIIKTLDEIHATDFSKIGKKDMCGRCDFCEMAGGKPV